MIRGIDIHNWFVIQFALLILTAPILETALKRKSASVIGRWTLLLLIVNVVFGYILGYVNVNGYNYMNFILLYFMGRYVKAIKESRTSLYIHIRRYGILYWILSSLILMTGMFFLWCIGHVPSSIKYFGYNNPLILISAFCLFVVFSSFRIQSRLINIIATGMFGVFLLHTPPEIIPIRNVYSAQIFENYGYVGIFVETIVLFIVLTLIAVTVERFNNKALKFIYGIIKK